MDLAQIVTAPNGDLLAGDNHDVFRFSEAGQLLSTLAYYGVGLTIDATGALFESSGDQVLRLHDDGTVSVLYAGPSGTEFEGLAATATGFAVTSPSGVLLINADGSLRRGFGARDLGSLQQPWAAWGTADGGLLVADAGNQRIARYGPSGDYLGRADAGGQIFPTFGAFDPVGGGSVVTDVATSTIKRFSVGGALLAQWPAQYDGRPYSPSGVAVAPDGTVYVVGGGSVSAYTPSGAQLRQITDQHVNGRTVPAVGPTGRLYLAGFGRQGVDTFDAGGGFAGSVPGLECTQVTSIAIDAAGRIFVIERAGLGFSGIGILAPDGTWLAQFGSGFLDGALSVDANDRLTIALRMQNAVVRVQIDVGALHAIKPAVPTGSLCNLSVGTARLPSSTLIVTRRVASLVITCVGPPAARCVGTAALRAAATAPKRSPSTAPAPKRSPRAKAAATPVLARGAFLVTGGQSTVVPLRLNRRYVAGRRTTRAQLTLTTNGGRQEVRAVYLEPRPAPAKPRPASAKPRPAPAKP